jgi:hypothetical protein
MIDERCPGCGYPYGMPTDPKDHQRIEAGGPCAWCGRDETKAGKKPKAKP